MSIVVLSRILASRKPAVFVLFSLALAVACNQPAPLPTAAPEPTAGSTVQATPTPALPPSATPSVSPTLTPTVEPEESPVRLEIIEGSVARYRVKEQFARRDLPNDAVGETSDVAGVIVLDANGAVQSDQSKITVNLRTLRSDDDDRDDFLRTDALESDRFPLAEFVVEQATGLPWPLPEGEEFQLELQGSMTAHGVTSPLTWQVSAQVAAGKVTGQALTNFTFATFDMEKPSVFFLLSVDDDIRLELDFVANLEPG